MAEAEFELGSNANLDACGLCQYVLSWLVAVQLLDSSPVTADLKGDLCDCEYCSLSFR